MISEEEALAAVLANVVPGSSERLRLIDSLGKFAAEELRASRPLPMFDNSAMDGYAVQAASTRPGAKLRVIGEQPAGLDRGLTIAAGEAIRIFTGAPIPRGADAIVMQEEVTPEGNFVATNCLVAAGEFVRQRGTDLAQGQTILSCGDPITPATLGVLASQGLSEICVGTQPRVAIISTGDELAQLGETPEPGQIFESNGILLHALTLHAGARVTLVEHAPDELDRTVENLRRGLASDVLLICGGVSVGDHDLVKPALRALGAEIDLWRVAMKPGKPFLFGSAGDCHIFGLPGNPVSAFITFLTFVRPALRKMAGAATEYFGLRKVPARLADEVKNAGDRPHYFRGVFDQGIFALNGSQESHALFGLSRSNALLRLDPQTSLSKDADLTVLLLD
jgi:molybdopterin molybdotransferase